jgi:hypothetical protein
MSVLLPNSDFGWIRADAKDLDLKLRTGDGIQWSGDPNLELRQGVVEEVKWGRPTGKIVARRWEVWRHCEDGIDRSIGHWRMEEFDRILFDLAKMQAGVRGHENVIDAIERDEVAREKVQSDRFADSYGGMLEHMAKLWHDRNEGRNVFRGMPGQNPDRQM